MNTISRHTLGACLLSVFAVTPIYAQVADPAAGTTPPHYESVFSDYRPQQELALLPWKNLFTTDGEFAPVSAMPASEAQAKPSAQNDKPAQITQADSAPAKASDTRGRIESINTAEGKVKFKHGPIPKFDMPGMTMVFRVQDPKLLTQIKVGDEVGATLDKSGSGFVITGFQK